jgi:hypothetical protein
VSAIPASGRDAKESDALRWFFAANDTKTMTEQLKAGGIPAKVNGRHPGRGPRSSSSTEPVVTPLNAARGNALEEAVMPVGSGEKVDGRRTASGRAHG